MAETIDYAELISRHVLNRLVNLPREKVQQVLDRCGLELLTGVGVRNRAGTPVRASTALLYKKAIREVLGNAPYEMTKLNFMLAGCECADCRGGMAQK
jgi:hypothetical protein